MTIDELKRCLGDEIRRLPTGATILISGITEDSRGVGPGFAFCAVSGETTDGHEYVDAARDAGAAIVIGERDGIDTIAGLPYVQVKRARSAAGLLAHALTDDPTASMHVIGVTGTNGKTTVTQLIAQLLTHADKPVACLGTLGYAIGDTHKPAAHTTPFGETLAALFNEARDANIAHAVMEVSSHAIAQDRIAGVHFSGAVFTNLTQDHLDYHESLEAYRDTKAELFSRLPENGFAVVNADDSAGETMAAAAPCSAYRYGASGDVQASDVRVCSAGTRFVLSTPWGNADISTRLIGAFNVSNMLAAATAACASGIAFETVCDGLERARPVAGRFELVDAGQPYGVIVDYAHTDDGLRNMLASARPLCKGRLIVVFGCGGDRDKMKRPRMARAVAEAADFAVITSDNPRTEDPERILLDTEVGMQRAGKHIRDDYVLILDRREAIAHALSMATDKDVVVIAGKGHEDYQILGTHKIHFDDREVVRELLQTGAES